MKLYEIIKKLRQARGLRQEDIAAQLNIERQAYQKIESGKTALTTDRLEQIAAIFGLKPEDIYAQLGKKQPVFPLSVSSNKDAISGLLEKTLANQVQIIENLQEQNRLLQQYLNDR